MRSRSSSYDGDHAIAALTRIDTLDSISESFPPSPIQRRLPPPSEQRRLASLQENPFDLQTPPDGTLSTLGGGPENPDTVLYLAYGSNLCAETFQGKRGIRPISQLNVVVPDLAMTFDLAGFPYIEPCFANTRYRTDQQSPTSPSSEKSSHSPLLFLQDSPPEYHKTRWHKGLVGVVYEVTKPDFAHIIATEGGGASYHDILIPCHELSLGTSTVPLHPTTTPFNAHTLFSPVQEGTYNSRPDPNYAQPSARYLKLITDGADEHGIPTEYKTYLHSLRPYTITTQRQRLGKWIFLMTWMPLVTFVFRLTGMFADKKGRSPRWVVMLVAAIFRAVWASYDGVFKRAFGDGERTVYDGDGEGEGEGAVEGREEGLDRVASGENEETARDYGAVQTKKTDFTQWV